MQIKCSNESVDLHACCCKHVDLCVWCARGWLQQHVMAQAASSWAGSRSGIKRKEQGSVSLVSPMQLHWERGQQAYHALKGSCYSERRCEVCGTFCLIMWRLLGIHVRGLWASRGLIRFGGSPLIYESKITSWNLEDDGNPETCGGGGVGRRWMYRVL